MQELAISNNNQMASVNANSFNIPTGYICTLNLDEISGKLALAQAINGATTTVEKIGDVLRVVDFVTTPGVRSRTGETCTNSYLILEDGSALFTQSDGVARSVAVIVATFTDKLTGAYTNPVSLGVGCKIIEEKLQNGNTLKKLLPVSLDA